jgi:hypothetical protein
MAIYFDIINLMRNYMVFNELKVHMKNNHCKKFFNVHVKTIKIEIHPKMIMIWTYENMAHLGHSKVHNFFWVKVFLINVLHISY